MVEYNLIISKGIAVPIVSDIEMIEIPITNILETHSVTISVFQGSPYGFPKPMDR